MGIRRACFVLMISLSTSVVAEEYTCKVAAVPQPAEEILEKLKTLTDCLYQEIATLKVTHDGEGKLSVHYENGVPKLLRLSYKNKKKTFEKVISFDDLEKGKPLIYENAEKKGRAIVFEKGENFKQGEKYNFKLSIRSSVNPEKHSSYPLSFDSDVKAPKVSSNQVSFSKMIFTPGISFLSWDGTFKRVDFAK